MSHRILIVDDDADLRRLLTLSLERIGGMSALALDGGEGLLKEAATGRWDAVLLDVMMPGLDGPACLAQLRQDPRTDELPVIFLTAKGDAAELRRLQELSGRPSMRKPFDPMTLADELRAILAS
ncbi:MAG: response regulator [Planctomycetota bacterium]|nr:response regulator [Planctomycetota bacterium]